MQTSNVRLVRRADLHRVPWHNGGGVTSEIAACTGPTLLWRLSVAQIPAGLSEFSAFQNTHRVFTIVGAQGVRLELDGLTTDVEPLRPFPFDGSHSPRCVAEGETEAFNVMADSRVACAEVRRRTINEAGAVTEPDTITVVYVVRGTVEGRDRLARSGDSLIIDCAAIELEGPAEVLMAEIKFPAGQSETPP
ncbi:hypothetical protein CH273_11445 [Rhodococcus sp. 05-339-2]|uniref:HutD/Ves family protein n=1 Tax=Rhodococcoides fascians TaxID=1828 RepID=UPI00068FA1CE|nr:MULTISPECIES: HutD family protein [Rhodococcus]OZD81345.1 hypothetical protein CH273_11445 [Rhodococcus sp. 05-339-2]